MVDGMCTASSSPDEGHVASDQIVIAPGVRMPVVGLGTWRMSGDVLAGVLDEAIESGYRLVDTASYYRNEADVGAALRRCKISREGLFITTKIRGADQGPGLTSNGLEMSLRRLGLDYVDLLLIHWPLPMYDLYVATWEELVTLRERGLVRAIGVSNFNPRHLDRIVEATGVVPAVNQVQCNPAVQNAAMRTHNAACGVHTQAWEPLGIRSDVPNQPGVRDVATELGRTPGQIVLRWHLQRGNSAVPKTATSRRLQKNLDVFGWDIPAPLMQDLDRLDQGENGRVDPETNVVK
jgi:2,5-diketo-D-gluconate reductase A